jgi:hypothetical protein
MMERWGHETENGGFSCCVVRKMGVLLLLLLSFFRAWLLTRMEIGATADKKLHETV